MASILALSGLDCVCPDHTHKLRPTAFLERCAIDSNFIEIGINGMLT